MDKVRLGLFFRDAEQTKESLEKAKKMIEDVRAYRVSVCVSFRCFPCALVLDRLLPVSFHAQGGDWDRRNRLKVYEALALLTQRQVKKAAELLLDCIATFTCVELTSYSQFIFYAVVTNLLHLERTKLKKRIVDGTWPFRS